MTRQIILAFVVVLACVMIARLALAPIVPRVFGAHGPWVEGALTGAGAVVGIIVANKVLGIRRRR